MNFVYTGRSSAGAVSGVLEGVDTGAVADALTGRGITPLTIESAPGTAARTSTLNLRLGLRRRMRPKVTRLDVMLFSRQLHTLLKAGVPILRAFAGLEESATSERMRETLQQVRESLGSGIDLSMSLARHPRIFDGFYVALVRVGETTGRLDDVFMQLFRHLEFETFMSQQIKSALRYPMFVTAAMAVGMVVINAMVIPAFSTVFQSFGAELPLATRILMATSAFTIDYGWLLLLGGVAGAWAFRRWVGTTAGRFTRDRMLLRVPLAGDIVRLGMLARFARSFALSLKSGVPVAEAMSVVARTVDNRFIAQRIERMRESVERGESILRSATATGVFTPIVLQMIAIGEETGSMDELMEEVADLYTNEVQYALKTLGQQIEPIVIAVLGVLVLVLALGVFLPVWDLGHVMLRPGGG